MPAPILLALGACATPSAGPDQPQDSAPAVAVYLVGHGGHTGIAVRGADLLAGLWPESRFPQAEYLESFHLFRTCNVWTAQALRYAGLPIRDSITQEGLMSQARAIGELVNRPQR